MIAARFVRRAGPCPLAFEQRKTGRPGSRHARHDDVTAARKPVKDGADGRHQSACRRLEVVAAGFPVAQRAAIHAVLARLRPVLVAALQTVTLVVFNAGGLIFAGDAIADPGALVTGNLALLALAWLPLHHLPLRLLPAAWLRSPVDIEAIAPIRAPALALVGWYGAVRVHDLVGRLSVRQALEDASPIAAIATRNHGRLGRRPHQPPNTCAAT